MRIWIGHGSEHSSNLVMIGHFDTVEDATKAKEVLDRLFEFVETEVSASRMSIGGGETEFPRETWDVLRELDVFSISPVELEQFGYDISVEQQETKVIVETDEVEVSSLLKIFINRGARIEVYSAHHHQGTGYGRGRRRGG